MADDLAARLVHQAADALDEQVRGNANPESFVSSPEDWTGEARAAVVAVLEGLAETMPESIPAQVYGPRELRALAEQVKETHGG